MKRSLKEESNEVPSTPKVLDFPGGKVMFVPEMRFLPGEPGVLLWRGFTLQEFANQCFGNKLDYGKGRQMPIHYGSSRLNYFTVSSPIA
ncbi:hypothetical protein BHM03_00042016 [Ensete ventricosum]|nr:hypothetical protein BHM03_00042016 [Ensete ventricosum]